MGTYLRDTTLVFGIFVMGAVVIVIIACLGFLKEGFIPLLEKGMVLGVILICFALLVYAMIELLPVWLNGRQRAEAIAQHDQVAEEKITEAAHV